MNEKDSTEKNDSNLVNKKPISPYFVMGILALGVFMLGLDSYIFSPALPTIVKYFNTSYNWVSWTIIIYLLISTSILPLAGKFADVYGKKRIYVYGVIIFTIGSLACSLSWNILSLVSFRAIQAVGGGLILPSALAAMSSVASTDKQGRTISILSSMGILATIIGPNIGGFLIQHIGWRSIFYLNVPIGITSILLSLKIKESDYKKKHNIDYLGSCLLIGALIMMLLGLVRIETINFIEPTVFPLFIVSLFLFLLLYLKERNTIEPIINISILKKREVLGLNLAFMLTFAATTCTALFIPTYAQLVLHFNITNSGNILTIYTGIMFLMVILGGLFIDKFGSKLILLIGLLIAGFGFFFMAIFVKNLIGLIIFLIIVAIGWGSATGAYQVTVFSITPKEEKGSSGAILNTFKGIGGLFTPLIGGFFLTNANNNIFSTQFAFKSIFLIACFQLIIASLFIIFVIIYSKMRQKSITSNLDI